MVVAMGRAVRYVVPAVAAPKTDAGANVSKLGFGWAHLQRVATAAVEGGFALAQVIP